MLLTKKTGLKNFAVTVLLSVSCSIITIAAYHVYFSQRTVIMDIAGFIASQKEDYMAGKISAGELVQNIDTLVSQIETVKKDKLLVLDQTAVTGFAKGRSTVPDPSVGDDDDQER